MPEWWGLSLSSVIITYASTDSRSWDWDSLSQSMTHMSKCSLSILKQPQPQPQSIRIFRLFGYQCLRLEITAIRGKIQVVLFKLIRSIALCDLAIFNANYLGLAIALLTEYKVVLMIITFTSRQVILCQCQHPYRQRFQSKIKPFYVSYISHI